MAMEVLFFLLNSITAVKVSLHTLAAVGVASGSPNSTKILNIFLSGLAISPVCYGY